MFFFVMRAITNIFITITMIRHKHIRIKYDTEIIRAAGTYYLDVSEAAWRTGLDVLESLMRRNSVFEGLSDRRLEDIQKETLEIK